MKIICTIILAAVLTAISTFSQTNKSNINYLSINESIKELNRSQLSGKARIQLKSFLFHNLEYDFSDYPLYKEKFKLKNKLFKITKQITQLSDVYLLVTEIYQTWKDTSWIDLTKSIYDHNNKKLLVEAINQIWDGTNWEEDSKHIYTYDVNNNLRSELVQVWSGNGWTDDKKYSYIYDDNNNQSEALWEIWNGFDWVASGEFLYIYDENNNLLEERFQIWNLDHWVNNLLSTYTYTNNNLTNLTNQEWSDTDTNWVNISNFNYEYDSYGNQTLSIEQTWDNSNWVNISKYINTYDGNNNLTDKTYQTWNNNWVNNQYYSYTYDDNNNLTEQQTKFWNGSGWDNNAKSLYTYSNSLLSYQVDQTWDGANWMDFAKTYNDYDKNSNLIDNYYVTWEDTIWVNNYKNVYEYSTLTSVDKNHAVINNFKLFNNYPNPFNPSTIITWESPISGVQTLKIFDVLGREVTTLVNEYRIAGKYKIEFNPAADQSNLASGIYFYQLKVSSPEAKIPNGNKNSGKVFIQTKKMIYLK